MSALDGAHEYYNDKDKDDNFIMMVMIMAMIMISKYLLPAIDFATRYSDFLSQPYSNPTRSQKTLLAGAWSRVIMQTNTKGKIHRPESIWGGHISSPTINYPINFQWRHRDKMSREGCWQSLSGRVGTKHVFGELLLQHLYLVSCICLYILLFKRAHSLFVIHFFHVQLLLIFYLLLFADSQVMKPFTFVNVDFTFFNLQ